MIGCEVSFLPRLLININEVSLKVNCVVSTGWVPATQSEVACPPCSSLVRVYIASQDVETAVRSRAEEANFCAWPRWS